MGTEKLRIAVVLEATLGGTRKHVVDLVKYLVSQGHRVWFVYSIHRADQRFFEDQNILVASGANCVQLPMSKSLYNPANLNCIVKMAALFREQQIEVLHLHGAVAGALGRLAAALYKQRYLRKIFYSPHGGVLHKANTSLSGRAYVFIENLLRSEKLSYIAVSTDEQEKLQAVLNLSPAKINLVPNGIDVQALTQQTSSEQDLEQERSRLKLAPGDFVLLYPALFLQAKGHLNFFQTFVDQGLTLRSNVKILLAGHGPLEKTVKELVLTLPFHRQVHFLGFVKDIAKYFQIADAVLLPSVNEAFGYVLLEAMAFGKPVFATRVGGIPDVVQHNKTGFLYDLQNMYSLIEDINKFAENSDALKPFSATALRTVQTRFGSERTFKAISTIYENGLAE